MDLFLPQMLDMSTADIYKILIKTHAKSHVAFLTADSFKHRYLNRITQWLKGDADPYYYTLQIRHAGFYCILLLLQFLLKNMSVINIHVMSLSETKYITRVNKQRLLASILRGTKF